MRRLRRQSRRKQNSLNCQLVHLHSQVVTLLKTHFLPLVGPRCHLARRVDPWLRVQLARLLTSSTRPRSAQLLTIVPHQLHQQPVVLTDAHRQDSTPRRRSGELAKIPCLRTCLPLRMQHLTEIAAKKTIHPMLKRSPRRLMQLNPRR